MNDKNNDHHIEIGANMAKSYFITLINQFYKILPLKESGEKTLPKYLLSLQREMSGCKELVPGLSDDGVYLRLLSILQSFIDNDYQVDIVRSDVFKAINDINKLITKYSAEPEDGE